MPAKTPVSVPLNESGSMPACSAASHETSNNNRCCGSITKASFGEIPKNAASNKSASCKNPPSHTYDLPDTPGTGTKTSPLHPRPTGKPETPSRPSTTNPHNPSRSTTPPGYRHPTPTITTHSPTTPT